MTTERELERVLERWLVDGIDVMPDRVYLSILDRVERQPQHRAWRVSWRDSNVNAYLKPMLAVAAALVIAIGGFAIVTRPSGSSVAGTAPPVPTPSPSPSPAPTVPPTPPWDDGAQCGDQGCGGPQQPRVRPYTSRALEPALSYTLASDWVNARDWSDYFMLYPDTPANRTAFVAGGSPPYILVLPGRVEVSPTARCEGDPTSDAVAVDAAGFAAAIAARDGLETTAPAPVLVGGLSGLQLDVGLTPGGTTGCAADVPVLPLGESIAANGRYRLIVLDRPDGSTILIRLWAPTGDFDAFVAQAMPVVDSFEFDLGAQPAPSSS